MTVSTWCWKTASRQLSRLEAAMLTTTTTTVQMNQVPGGQNNRSIWTERQEEPAPPIVTCAAFPPVRVAPVAMIPCLGWIIFPSSRPSPPAMREPAYATRECSPHSIGRNPKTCTEGDRWMTIKLFSGTTPPPRCRPEQRALRRVGFFVAFSFSLLFQLSFPSFFSKIKLQVQTEGRPMLVRLLHRPPTTDHYSTSRDLRSTYLAISTSTLHCDWHQNNDSDGRISVD